METKTIILAILIAIAVIALVSAVTWSPQGDIDLKNRYNMTNLNYFDTFTMKSGENITWEDGGYIYDNSTALILGHK